MRHTAVQRGAPGQPVARPAPRRPDPTATRLAVAAGGIATGTTAAARGAAISGTDFPSATVVAGSVALAGFGLDSLPPLRVIDTIRGRNVQDALNILKFSPQRAAGMITKALTSAVASANEA